MLLILALLACTTDTKTTPAVDSAETGQPSVVDADHDGWPEDEDCDDDDASVHPNGAESCNGVDDDCDGDIDEDLLITAYRDTDGDGYGDDAATVQACEPPEGYAAQGGDCDDGDASVHPDADESCNGVDDDCDGEIDEGLPVQGWYTDDDGDGYGVGSAIEDCAAPSGTVDNADDCDDGDASVHPGATETCDATDDDCSGLVDDGASCPCDVEYDGGHTYLFCDFGSDWHQARAFCQTYGYDLASADSQAEDAWLYSTASGYDTGYWWIGGNDLVTEGAWTWSDGSRWSWQHWCGGEPNNSHGRECVPTSEEDCMVIAWGSGGCWNDYPCDCAASEGEPYRYICEAP